MKERGVPKRDGSGRGMRENKGRGNCEKQKEKDQGYGPKGGRRNRNKR